MISRQSLIQYRANAKVQTRLSPAPVGGWNTIDAPETMAPTDAVLMDNVFPDRGSVRVRYGSTQHSDTGTSDNVETLMSLVAGSVSKLVAATDAGNIYDATSASASSIDTGYSNGRWQWVQFSGSLHAVNGADAPIAYDGTSVTNPAWTGPTIANLSGVIAFKNRLFFWTGSDQSFWYAALNAVTGALTEFPLGSVASFGGNLIAAGSWSRDEGQGPDDYIAFFMSSGEVIIYQGTDPSDASLWALVGIYHMAKPITARGLMKIGGDLMVTTLDDYVSLNRIVATGGIGNPTKASAALRSAASSGKNLFGWQSVLFKDGGLAVFNVPNSNGSFDQHVLNTNTGAWCRYRDLDARCWVVHGSSLFFGTSAGKIEQAETGNNDDDSYIAADCLQAWSDLGVGQTKLMSLARPVISSSGNVKYSLALGFDNVEPSTPNPTAATATSTPWGSTWGSAWGPSTIITANWIIRGGSGQAVATRFKVNGLQDISWNRTDFKFQVGNNL